MSWLDPTFGGLHGIVIWMTDMIQDYNGLHISQNALNGVKQTPPSWGWTGNSYSFHELPVHAVNRLEDYLGYHQCWQNFNPGLMSHWLAVGLGTIHYNRKTVVYTVNTVSQGTLSGEALNRLLGSELEITLLREVLGELPLLLLLPLQLVLLCAAIYLS